MLSREFLGLSTFLGPKRGLDFWIELAADLGLGAVELRAEPALAHPGKLGPRKRASLGRKLSSFGLSATVHASIHGTNLASLNPILAEASLRDLLGTVDLAADLGAGIVVFHPGTLPEEYLGVDGALELARDALHRALEVAVPHAERRGVVLALENKQRGKGRDLVLTPEEHAGVLAEFPGIGACLDFGHLHTLGLDPHRFVAVLGDKVVHVHLHDNRGEVDEHLPLGEGSLDWATCIAALEGIGFRGKVVLEIPDPDGLRRSVELLLRHG